MSTHSRAYATKEDRLKLADIDPELQSLIAANPLPPVVTDINVFLQNRQAQQEAMLKVLGPPPEGVKETELHYIARDGHTNRGILFQPAISPPEGSPLVVLMHGGGFATGGPEGEAQTARNLVLTYGAVCYSVAYRLAPNHPFPAAPNDCWDALQWAASEASNWGADPTTGFIVGGSSAGGNLAAVLAVLARDSKLSPPLTGQYLAIPAICPSSETPDKYKADQQSYEQNKMAPVLPQAIIDMFMEAYQPDNKSPLFNVLAASNTAGQADLPPAFFQVDGLDPLRDEALIYDRILREEHGIKTKVCVYPGVPHAHWAFFPTLTQTVLFRKEQAEGFGWLLGRTPKVIAIEPPKAAVA